MAGIYVHIPYCRKACNYCDFHFSTNLKNKNDFLRSLKKEIKERKDELPKENFFSIYFGGGTPSVLNAGEISEILNLLNKNYIIDQSSEITLEANPDDLNEGYIKSIQKTGINRLSIGWQSFIPEELKWMNRTHSPEQNAYCLQLAQDLGLDNISVDLIYGSKFQTKNSWEEALDQVLKLKVEHLSCYNLTIEQNTALGRLNNKKLEPQIDDELSSIQFEILINWAKVNQYEHYEISNLAKNKKYACHNTAYWMGRKYIGFGPSAHSYDGNLRSYNVSNNSVYIKNLNNNKAYREKEMLTKTMKFNEYILTNLRTMWGIDFQFLSLEFSEFLPDALKNIKSELKEGYLLLTENKLILTDKGKKFADRIAEKLFII